MISFPYIVLAFFVSIASSYGLGYHNGSQNEIAKQNKKRVELESKLWAQNLLTEVQEERINNLLSEALKSNETNTVYHLCLDVDRVQQLNRIR